MAQTVKSLPARRKTWIRSLSWEDPLEKEMATHSSILTWKIPWTEEPGGLQSIRLQRVGHDWVTSLSLSIKSEGESFLDFPGGSAGKESACNAGDLGSILGLGISPAEGKGYPLQYSCLEKPMDREAWWATVHTVAKSQTWLRWLSMYAQIWWPKCY